MAKKVIGTPSETNAAMIERVQNVRVDDTFRYNSGFIAHVFDEIASGDTVLDCGRCSRDYFDRIGEKAGKLETLDVTDWGAYPDILCDLCEPIQDPELQERYDRIICLAVLEHCYDPFTAAKTLSYMLRHGGTLYGYVPWLFRYHAPEDLTFQDYMRFSRDSLAYMFRDASDLTLYPLHGPITAALHQVLPGKLSRKLNKRPGLQSWLDRRASSLQQAQQCSGYAFTVVK